MTLAARSVLAVLGACGSDPEANTGLNSAGSVLTALRRQPAAEPLRPTPSFAGLDPALIAGRSDPIMGAYLGSTGALAGLALAGRRGDRRSGTEPTASA